MFYGVWTRDGEPSDVTALNINTVQDNQTQIRMQWSRFELRK